MPDLSDEACLARLRDSPGDRQALGVLFERYDRRLQCHLRSRYPALNHEDLREVCQETWLKTVKCLTDKVQVAALRAWLYRVGENLAVDLFRRQNTRAEVAWADHEGPAPQPDPTHASAFKEQMQRCLEKLPEKYKDVMQSLLNLESYEEIAQKTSISKGRLYQIKHEIGKLLEACLEPQP